MGFFYQRSLTFKSNFFRIHPCITRQTLPFYQRPTRMECRTKKVSSFSYYCSLNAFKLSSYQLYDNAKYEQTVKPFDVKFTSILSFKQENLRPAWHCTDISNFYWTRPGWNKNILRKIQCVLIKSPVTCIQDQRVCMLQQAFG